MVAFGMLCKMPWQVSKKKKPNATSLAAYKLRGFFWCVEQQAQSNKQ
jgi:hypothetical protein